MLTWATPFNICCFLDNQGYQAAPLAVAQRLGSPSDLRRAADLRARPTAATPPPVFECLLAVGAAREFTASPGRAFAELKTWAADQQEWLFGHFAYDLALETEPSASFPVSRPGHQPAQPADPAPTPADPLSARADPIGFPALFFFLPEVVITLQADGIRIGSLGPAPETIWQAILAAIPLEPIPQAPIVFEPRFTREEYLGTIGALREHILRGDCYEINFCQEFYARQATLDPWAAWQALSKASPNPFSAFYRLGERYLLCASPERYLKRTGSILLSQPIKGTASRVRDDAAADVQAGQALANSAKDQAENVMVVDLVRNDLSRICRPGSVRVSELFGIYAFPQVFQMISTITGELLPGLHWSEAIRDTFPMGSMTGAPKNNVVRLIARYERSRRGIFSGALGYVTPDGDFDFNVVIRSLLYREDTGYLSYQVGSGITYNSDPAAEYEECLLKAQGIRKALGMI
jgi:para-aminobenzoate synthetase component I